jgi:hypothetical protein
MNAAHVRAEVLGRQPNARGRPNVWVLRRADAKLIEAG